MRISAVFVLAAATIAVRSPTIAAGATAINPCSLITARQVRAITHEKVKKKVLAPQGPTCIFYFANGRPEITLSIQSGKFTMFAATLQHRRHMFVGRHSAYCGTIGQSLLYVSLPRHQILTISASCVVAKQIAAIAVKHVPS